MRLTTNYFKNKKNKIARFVIQTIINMLAAVLTAVYLQLFHPFALTQLRYSSGFVVPRGKFPK